MDPSFERYVEDLRPRIEREVAAAVSALLADLPVTDRPRLQTSLVAGKKLRGVLLCLVAEALGGAREAALPRAAAVELIQTASLIHDDVVDEDTVRRRLPAVWTVEGIRRAILLGDVVFASAIHAMGKLSRADGLTASRAIAKLARGACQEPLDAAALARAIRSGSVTGDLYERIIRLKTGVLFAAACEFGAVAAGSDDDITRRLSRWGSLIGEAYQIADDLEDLRPPRAGAPPRPAELLPAVLPLLRFSPGAGRLLPVLLEGGASGDAVDRFAELLRHAVPAMEAEVEERLRRATRYLDGTIPEGPLAPLLRRAPRELLERFVRDGEGLKPPSRP